MRTRARTGFTLAEMLAVIGIMLVLMVAAFGLFGMFAEQVGPDAAISTIQAMLNNARDYAATYGVVTQVAFTVDVQKPLDGTTMTLQYYAPGSTNTPTDVPGRQPFLLRNQTYVCRDMPATLPAAPGSGVVDARDLSESQLADWARYRQQLLDAVGSFAASSGKIDATRATFFIVFDPAGYVSQDPPAAVAARVPEYGMTIVQLGGNKVIGYAFYPMNMNAGTRLVFQE